MVHSNAKMILSCDEWYASGRLTNFAGSQVFYQQSGDGPYLICLHGFPTSSWDFACLWPDLTARFNTTAVDLIGLGKSIKSSQSISVALQANMIEELLVMLDIGEAHILAHDLGDTVAQELLARQMESRAKVRWLSCVFLNGGLFPESHHPRLIQKLLVSPFGPWVAKWASERTLRKSLRGIFSPQHPPNDEFVAASWKLIAENNGTKVFPEILGYMKERVIFRERWLRPLEHGLVPLRLINGILDPVSGYEMADRYSELVPEADVVMLDEAGHYPHIELPEATLQAFLSFHSRLPQNRVYN